MFLQKKLFFKPPLHRDLAVRTLLVEILEVAGFTKFVKIVDQTPAVSSIGRLSSTMMVLRCIRRQFSCRVWKRLYL